MKTLSDQINELKEKMCGRCYGKGKHPVMGGTLPYPIKDVKCGLCDGTGIGPKGVRTYTMTVLVEVKAEVRDPIEGESVNSYFTNVVFPAFDVIDWQTLSESDSTRHVAGEVWCDTVDEDDDYCEGGIDPSLWPILEAKIRSAPDAAEDDNFEDPEPAF